MKQVVKYSKLVVICVITFACTDLTEDVVGPQVSDDFYSTESGANAALADIYAEIRADYNGNGIAGGDRGWFDLQESCTDEMIIPTRSDGTWADNGIWISMYTHDWDGNQEFMLNTWNWTFRAINKANFAVETLTNLGADQAFISEAKVLRAFFYYMTMDLWGDVPFFTSTTTAVDDAPQTPRADIFDFVVKEIEENIEFLSQDKGGEYYGRINKWAALTLLLKVYMNGKVYTDNAYWTEAIATADEIINNGGFSLQADLYDNIISVDKDGDQQVTPIFGDVLNSNEVIMAIFVSDLAPLNIIGTRSLFAQHTNAILGYEAWNGACVLDDFVNLYNDSDKRKSQWLLGDFPGDVTYTANIASLTNAGLTEGARSGKFFPLGPIGGNGEHNNDFPIFRYSDVLLMKAEAILRNSGGEADARTLVDEVRNRAGLDDFSGTMTLDEILAERGRELCWEGHRRQDLIRFDEFTGTWQFKPASQTFRTLFPIPTDAINRNKTLIQNDGYN